MSNLQRNSFKVRAFQRAMRFANSLAALPNKLVPAPFRLIQIGSAYWHSRALYVAAELGVADAIGDQGGNSREPELARRLSLPIAAHACVHRRIRRVRGAPIPQ